jgi:hypothetical protein
MALLQKEQQLERPKKDPDILKSIAIIPWSMSFDESQLCMARKTNDLSGWE